MFRSLGARATPARVAVLTLLESAERALSHHDVEEALADSGFDRVTLYRVLDWMERLGLAQAKISGEPKLFRVFRKPIWDIFSSELAEIFKGEGITNIIGERLPVL